MRLVEYIRAEHKKFESKIIDAAIRTLKKGYSQHYKFVSDNLVEMTDVDFESHWSRCFFYRGTHGPKIFERPVRQNRKPKDTSASLHKWLDEEFDKKFGWKPRSTGLFASGDYDTAAGYQDDPYIIFPSNGYKFIWSPKIIDIWKDLKFGDFEDPESYQFQNMWLKRWYEIVETFPKNEFGEREDAPTYPEFLEGYTKDWRDKVVDVVKTYKNTDLDAALKSGNEIVFGCQKYFAIQFSQYGEIFAKRVRELEYK